MLCLRFCRSAHPCTTILGGIIPPTPAISQPFKSVAQPCRSVTAKQYPQYVPFQRPLLSNHFQDHGAQNFVQKGRYHWSGPSESPLLLSRLAPPRILPFLSRLAFTQSSTRSCLIQNLINWRSHATAHDASAIFLQPLDPSCRRQSIRRGFAISLPILVLYVLLYLLHFVPQESELGRRYMSTVARFWTYRRHEGFQNIASLGTYVTSQFTHDRLQRLVIDSVVLVGVASILSSVFSCRTFFAVYVCGGFLAAAADCAWARLTNPCRNFTQAQLDQCSTFDRLLTEARAKLVKINPFSFFTEKGLNEIRTNKGDIAEDYKEFQRLKGVIDKHLPYVQNWAEWNVPNWAARGSLACLGMPPIRWASSLFFLHTNRVHSDADAKQQIVTVATFIRPRTMITLMGVRSSVSLYKLTACFFVLDVFLEPVTGVRSAISPGTSKAKD